MIGRNQPINRHKDTRDAKGANNMRLTDSRTFEQHALSPTGRRAWPSDHADATSRLMLESFGARTNVRDAKAEARLAPDAEGEASH